MTPWGDTSPQNVLSVPWTWNTRKAASSVPGPMTSLVTGFRRVPEALGEEYQLR